MYSILKKAKIRPMNLVIFLFLFCTTLLCACSVDKKSLKSADASVSETSFFLDTVVTITLMGTKDDTLLKGCDEMLEKYENLLSRTRKGSDVWNINHSGGKVVTVSDETAALLQIALNYCELSEGAFDITIAPVVSLWNFTDAQKECVIPDAKSLSHALQHVDYHTVKLDGNTVQLLDPEASIDLGGIAKGYIGDCLRDYLKANGIERALINLGGNLLAVGEKLPGTPWKLGIRKPFAESSDLLVIIEESDVSLVTSGTYERYFEKDGKIYHHILDPVTGYPKDNGLTSVSILSSDSVDGDALSTTCFLLGSDKGFELAESLDGIEAMFVDQNTNIRYTSGFPH